MPDFYEIDFLDVEAAKSGDAITLRYELQGVSYIHIVDGGYKDTGQRLVDHIRAHYGNPADAPFIGQLRPLLEAWLDVHSVPLSAAKAISDRLASYFVYALNQEWRKNTKAYQPILLAVTTPFTKAGEREWAWSNYNALLAKRIHEGVFDEPFSLAQLYVPLNAFYIDESIALTSGDGPLGGSKSARRVVVDLEEELDLWLARQDPADAIRVLSGGPGSGKSSFARIFASKVASAEKIRVLFVPLHLIDATKNLVDEVGRFVRDEGVLAQNPLDPDSPEPNLFVIFDGLDELSSQGKAAAETARAFIREVDRTVEKRNLQGPRLRILLSGRELVVQENESELRRPGQILNLLPYYVSARERATEHASTISGYQDRKNLLKRDLRSEWWKKYGKLSGRTYTGLPKELKREDLEEVTSQPLLNYLVALSFTRGKITFTGNVNLNLIYSDLVAAVYQRGYEKKRTYGPIRHMSMDQFSRVLEEVGLAAWHGDGRSTTVKEIEEHCRQSGVGGLLETFQEGAKVGVTRLLAAFFFRQHGQRASGDPTFVFTHKSFGEYLTARRIIRAAERIVRNIERRINSPDEGWDEREALRHWVQICGPSAVSPYLHSFLLNELAIRDIEEVGRWQEILTRLLSHVIRHGLPMEQLQLPTFRDLMFRSRNAEEALLVILNACARRTKKLSAVEHHDRTSFGAWFKRIQGQRATSESGLAARCLSYLNLSGVCLDIADLYSADLSFSDLKDAALHITCLERANLSRANLQGVRAWKANFTRANLEEANLRDAILEETDLRAANLKGVMIGEFKVRESLIEGLEPADSRRKIHAQSIAEQKEYNRRFKPQADLLDVPESPHSDV